MLSLLALALTSVAHAACPSEVTIQGELSCSSSFAGTVSASDDSLLGGTCEDGLCYTCGEPYANENQEAPEAVYTFTCQQSGTVTMLITDLTCDLDIYVLDDSCDPNAGCLMGSTAPYAADDSVEFACSPGETYYIVVEAYGTAHLEDASGPCTDDGTATGTVYDPGYTLSFDVSASTGCAEDCDDGLDNDLDGPIDCDDSDCLNEATCCDLDGDGHWAEECGGNDCDDGDASIHPNAPEGDAHGNGDGVNNDCDDLIDEGTNDYDDDGDGYTENQGDCDDDDTGINPDAEDATHNGVDEDCDGTDGNDAPEDTDPPEDTEQPQDTEQPEDTQPPTGDDTGEGQAKEGGCECSAGSGRAGLFGLVALLGLAFGLRRRR